MYLPTESKVESQPDMLQKSKTSDWGNLYHIYVNKLIGLNKSINLCTSISVTNLPVGKTEYGHC